MSPDVAPPIGYGFNHELRASIVSRIAGFNRRSLDTGEVKHAAVAITLVGDEDGRACYLLTRRASTLSSHKGQWALPGGRLDPGETAAQAAHRELHEELGVELSSPVLGILDDYATRSGYVITPVVLWGGTNPRLVPNVDEVESAHQVPLTELDRPEAPTFVTIPESDRPVIQMPMFERTLYAPLAAVLYQFREVALHGRHTRITHLEQPVFAWK